MRHSSLALTYQKQKTHAEGIFILWRKQIERKKITDRQIAELLFKLLLFFLFVKQAEY